MKRISALIIGYGSIGRRHAKILQSLEMISKVVVCTSQFDIPYETINSLEEIPKLNPDYIIICSDTCSHKNHLTFLEENFIGKKILVEKPLFESFNDLEINNNQVFVGYNLRFHPILKKIKEKTLNKDLWNIEIFCGSYLPDWRSGRDYRISASAKKETGGGVLLDLSHELDYVRWLAGSIDIEHQISKKISNLDIETDDILLLSGKVSCGAHVHISLNYFTRKPVRQIIIDGLGISIQANLITNKVTVYENETLSEFDWPELERNTTYLAEHKAIFENDLTTICTYKEGLETMRLIDNIRSLC